MTSNDIEMQRSIEAEVEVATNPDTAFRAFTDELDLWWVRGPINHHAGGRVLAMRCEPGVGGRLLEVYDDSTGDALELARITAWEPGRRLAWQSSLDDVSTEVTFQAAGASTTGGWLLGSLVAASIGGVPPGSEWFPSGSVPGASSATLPP